MSFRDDVFAVVKKIPKGRVMTYAEVAKLSGHPRAYRAVGNILTTNHDPEIPCHRVVKTDGTIGGYNGGAAKKRKILASEGVFFND